MRVLVLVLSSLAYVGCGRRGYLHLKPESNPDLHQPSGKSPAAKWRSPRALALLFLANKPATAWQITGAEHHKLSKLLRTSCHGVAGCAATGQQRAVSRGLAMQEPATRLTPLPDYLGVNYSPVDRRDVKYLIKECTKKALRQALDDGQELLEIEFPPLIDSKGQFDDFSNIEVFDANQKFMISLASDDQFRKSAPGSSFWVVYADATEAKLARKSFKEKGLEAVQLSISAALERLAKEAIQPQDPSAIAYNIFSGLFGDGKTEKNALADLDPSEVPKLQVVVQPGEYGPVEDWLNMEVLKDEGVPMVCMNGALDKVRGKYYGLGLWSSDLNKCADRFFTKFEALYYLKPLSAGSGWLFRVYPEPWQLYGSVSGESFKLIETYEQRPTLGEAAQRLSRR